MLRGHPKGLLVVCFSNMGERFGYYTMLAILTLFIQAKYGYTAAEANQVYGIFTAFVYFMPLLGGYLADRVLGYGRSIGIGMVVMFAGYLLMAIPSGFETGPGLVFIAMAIVALGTGLFKGNLQALIGNMYDAPEYSGKRDAAFMIFYMIINIGAMFAPTAAEEVCNWVLGRHGLVYSADIPALAHKFLRGDTSVQERLFELMLDQPSRFGDLTISASTYLNALSEGYHFAFGVACVSLVASMLIFWGFRKLYRQADRTEREKVLVAEQSAPLSPEQTRARLFALFLVFSVVIFFWMAFQQSGTNMTIFARDYTEGSVDRFANLWFDLFGLLALLLSAVGLYFTLHKSSSTRLRVLGLAAELGFGLLAWWRFNGYPDENPFAPQRFQHFNPFFIVALTPLFVALFGWLGRCGREPSAPRKIALGMLGGALAFAVLAVGSLRLQGVSPGEIGEVRAPATMLVSPYWLISTYFILTVAELFLSPMGSSFVSRVAPPRYKGLMQGCWFAATAIGNYAAGLIGLFWSRVQLWAFWSILVVCCVLSAIFILAVVRRLEAATA